MLKHSWSWATLNFNTENLTHFKANERHLFCSFCMAHTWDIIPKVPSNLVLFSLSLSNCIVVSSLKKELLRHILTCERAIHSFFLHYFFYILLWALSQYTRQLDESSCRSDDDVSIHSKRDWGCHMEICDIFSSNITGIVHWIRNQKRRKNLFIRFTAARVTVKHGFKIPIEALILSVNDTFLFCCSYTTINTIISITLNWLDNKTISVNVEQPRVLPLSAELNRRYETRFSAVWTYTGIIFAQLFTHSSSSLAE